MADEPRDLANGVEVQHEKIYARNAERVFGIARRAPAGSS
jgi:hypothetical protein